MEWVAILLLGAAVWFEFWLAERNYCADRARTFESVHDLYGRYEELKREVDRLKACSDE